MTLLLITEADPSPHFILLEQPSGEQQENALRFLPQCVLVEHPLSCTRRTPSDSVSRAD